MLAIIIKIYLSIISTVHCVSLSGFCEWNDSPLSERASPDNSCWLMNKWLFGQKKTKPCRYTYCLLYLYPLKFRAIRASTRTNELARASTASRRYSPTPVSRSQSTISVEWFGPLQDKRFKEKTCLGSNNKQWDGKQAPIIHIADRWNTDFWVVPYGWHNSLLAQLNKISSIHELDCDNG